MVVILLVALLLFVRSPWGQEIIIQKAVSYVSGKTGTAIAIEELYFTFSGNLYLQGLYLEDTKGDTLIYSQSLDTGIDLWPLIKSGEISISKIDWQGVVANVETDTMTNSFNFDFLIDAFVTPDSTAAPAADSTSSFPQIDFGPVYLKDFRLRYHDPIMGIVTAASWKDINIEADKIDLNKMDFGIQNILIAGADISFFQTKQFSEPDTLERNSSSPLPLLVLEKFQILDSKIIYSSIPDGIYSKVKLGDFQLELPEANLENQKVLLKSLTFSNADIELRMTEATEPKPEPTPSDQAPFSWPDWWVEVGSISLDANNFSYFNGEKEVRSDLFEADAVSLTDLNFEARNVFLKDEKAKATVENISFLESSGLQLTNLSTAMIVDDTGLDLKEIIFKTGNSLLEGDVSLTYGSMDDLINNPDRVAFDIDIQTLETDAKEALYIVPEMAKEVYFKEIARNGIKASGNFSGNLSQIKVQDLELLYGKSTSLAIDFAQFDHLLDLDKLMIDLPELDFQTKGQALRPFLDSASYELPEEIRLIAKAEGSFQEFHTKISLNTSDGSVEFKGDLERRDRYILTSTIDVNELNLGKILEMEELAPLSLHSNIQGSGSGFYDVEGMLDVDFIKLGWADQDLSELKLTLTAKDTFATLNVAFEKEFLDMGFVAKAKIDTVQLDINFGLDLKNLQMQDLGLTAQDIRTKFKLAGNINGELDDLNGSILLSEGIFELEDSSYPIGEIDISAKISEMQTMLQVKSDFLEGFFNVNGTVDVLTTAIDSHLKHLIGGDSLSAQYQDLMAESAFKIHPTPFIDRLLLSDIGDMDTIDVRFGYEGEDHELRFFLNVPHLEYLGAVLDTFSLAIEGNEKTLGLELGFLGLGYDPVAMGKTQLSAAILDEKIKFGFTSQQKGNTIINFTSEFTNNGDTIFYTVNPEGLIFNGVEWDISPDNQVKYASDFISFRNFIFTRENQSLGFRSDFEGLDMDHFGLIFSDFGLQAFLGFLNPENPLARGTVNGNFVLINPFSSLGFVADMDIRQLEVTDIPLGNLDVLARAVNLDEYDFNLSLKEGMADLDISGGILADSVNTNLDLNINLNSLQMSLLETLSDSAIRNTEGYIEGKIKIGGSIQEPQYDGNLTFKKAKLLVGELNTSFSLEDEKISLSNEAVFFDGFVIKDSGGSEFVVDGKVKTENLADMGLDLRLKTKNFQVMNSTRKDSDLFFGKASVDMDLKIEGTTTLPRINLLLKVNEGTEVSFIVPEDQLDLVERTGVVIFVNHQDPYDLINQREGEIRTKGIVGYDVRATLNIDAKTVFNLIVDERTNDNLRIQGRGDLSMLMNPNGDISLSGRYEVNSGHYEMNLFNLVNRRFELAQGSTVIWRGDPMNASLDLKAIYNVRTSAAELMQAQLTGSASDTKSQFRQVLPFMVYLNIDGELLKPEISFELDLAEQERGAFGGSVYAMLQQINEQEDEVTKQVFSLLVLNQFFPVMGNDGSGGGTVNLARSSVSQVLASQLNALSDKLFGQSGFSLDFDLDSYTDFQSGAGEDRTQLNVAAKQKLMDDRLVISVGGQMDVEGGENQNANQGDALFGDVSLEYLLDERGQWRAKAYRKNQFESVIDGQLVVTGISLIFNKEFNSFKGLWMRTPKQPEIKEEESVEKEVENKTNSKDE